MVFLGFFTINLVFFLFSLSIVVNCGNIRYYDKWRTTDSFVYFALLLNLLSTEKLKRAKIISKCQANYFCPCVPLNFVPKFAFNNIFYKTCYDILMSSSIANVWVTIWISLSKSVVELKYNTDLWNDIV